MKIRFLLTALLLFLFCPAFIGSAKAQSCLPGDANNDCKVDGVDYVDWSNNYNKTTSNGSSDADFNNSGTVDGLDYVIWLNNYGKDNSLPFTSTPAAGSVFWRGDAETGDLSQWQVRAPGMISVVTNPVGQGRYAYKYTLNANFVSQGGKEAVWLSSHGRHSEVNGEEKYYGWQVYIPADFPTNSLWSLVMQFKGEGTGSPPVALGYKDNSWSVNSNPTAWTGHNSVLAKFPATKGRWEKFVYHIKWSTDPSVGFVEVWYNGKLVLPKRHVSTVHVSGGPVTNYIDIGMYRDPGISDTVTFYHDGFVTGSTYASVAQ